VCAVVPSSAWYIIKLHQAELGATRINKEQGKKNSSND